MATSGTSTFNANRNQVITQAARKVGALRDGQSLGNATIANFEFMLNAMVKQWQAKGLHVWTVAEGVLIPQASQISYGAGGTATDHIMLADDLVQTTLSADEALGQTTLSISDTSDLAAAQHIGIVLDDGTIQWTSITSKTSTTVLVPAPLTDSASAGNAVFAYANRIVRPIKVVAARRYNIESAQEIDIKMTARLDYQALTDKTRAGTINQVFYDPQLSTGVFKLYQPPSLVTDLVKFTWWRPIQDFNIGADNPDLPQEWITTLIFNLAVFMSPDYNVQTEKFAMIKTIADGCMDDVSGFDRENESIQFGVDMEE